MTGPVLVTGANGFIGSHLVEGLLARGERVRCLVRPTSDLRYLQPLLRHETGDQVEWAYGDVNDPPSLRAACAGVRAVCHLAGVTKARDGDTYRRVNAEGTRHLLEACLAVAPHLERFVLFSSLAAAGPSPDGHPLDETAPPHPISFYGQSKLQAEAYVQEYEARLPVVILRPAPVYGPRDRDIYVYFKMAHRGLALVLPDRRTSLIHVADLVELSWLALTKEQAIGQTYFAADGQTYEWTYLARVIAAALNRRPLYITVPDALLSGLALLIRPLERFARRPLLLNTQKIREMQEHYWVCDVSKARRELGFIPRVPLEQGVRETARWYRKQGWL